ncbi:MAG: Hsp20/alpha crystallin family protein [bacterium]
MRSLTTLSCIMLGIMAVSLICATPAVAAAKTASESAGSSLKPTRKPAGPGPAPLMDQDIWAEMRQMQQRLNRIVEDAAWRFQAPGPMWGGVPGIEFYPDVDVRETDTAIIVRCDLPGMEKDKIDVSFRDGSLIIRGQRNVVKEESKSTGWYMRERNFGSFERAIPIATDIKESEITADYKNGVLRVRLPKADSAMKPGRKIQIL